MQYSGINLTFTFLFQICQKPIPRPNQCLDTQGRGGAEEPGT